MSKRGLDCAPDTGFRIDDDAVVADYIEKTHSIADPLLDVGWADENSPTVVAFHRGIFWNMDDPDKQGHDFFEMQPLGLVSAMITPIETQSSIYRRDQCRFEAHARCWIDPTDTLFIRTLHRQNDSDRSFPPGAGPVATPRACKMFGLDPARVIPLMRRGQCPDSTNMAEDDTE